jgi:hypothetical protein
VRPSISVSPKAERNCWAGTTSVRSDDHVSIESATNWRSGLVAPPRNASKLVSSAEITGLTRATVMPHGLRAMRG